MIPGGIMPLTYIVHYGELGLKGHNRINFERMLVANIQRALEDLGPSEVRRSYSRILVAAPAGVGADVIEARLRRIAGIAYVAPVTTTGLSMDAIIETALSMAQGIITPDTRFRVTTARGNKQFPLTSPEISREVGARIIAATGAAVDLHTPDITLTIQIYDDEAHLFLRRIQGLGGLPYGSSGRVLALFSGGIDSPVAAHLMMKRGCAVDFLHFHLLRGQERIHESKVVAMARALLLPHRAPGRLYMVSAAPFESAMAALDSHVATVVFRRFIMRAAEAIARQRKAPALVTGESVGQVASQTLMNINVIAQATGLPILRPLIGMDKLEIIGIAQAIGSYELSIQPYQDPCSLHALNPSIWSRIEDVQQLEDEIGVEALLRETLENNVEQIRIKF
jgi:thiamine biosynthesis protein ThiI